MTGATLATYLVWAITPENVIKEKLGIEFLPQKYWAVAIPIYIGVAFTLFVFVVYPSLGLCITPNLDDIRNVVDVDRARFVKNGKTKEGSLVVGDMMPKDVIREVFGEKEKRD